MGQVKKDFPIYKVGEEHLSAIEGQKPATKASSIAATTKAHLRPKVGQNPRYERLSERVEEVLSQWKSGQIADPEAVDALEELERETVAVEEEAGEKGFSGAEHATYALLHDDYGFAEERAHETAETLCRALDQEVDTSFEGWWENEKAQRKVKVQIYRTLAQTETPEGLDKRALGSELRDYLIANYANRHTD